MALATQACAQPVPGGPSVYPSQLIAPNPNSPQFEGEGKVFAIRFQCYIACWENWLRQMAPLNAVERSKAVDTVNAKRDMLMQIHWATAGEMPELKLPPQFPVLFMNPRLAIDGITSPDQLRNLVEASHLQKLEEAERERREFRLAAYRDYAVSILDAELFLTTAQKEAIRGDRQFLDPLVDHSLFTVSPPKPPLWPYERVAKIVSPENRERLTTFQKARFPTLGAPEQPSRLSFKSAESHDDWDARVDAHVQQKRDEIQGMLMLQSEFLEGEGLLSREQAQKLQLAAKGVSVQMGDELSTSLHNRLDQFVLRLAQRPGVASTFNMSAVVLAQDAPFKHPVWLASWNEIGKGPVQARLDQRVVEHLRIRDRAVLAMLDSELWLRPDQREKLLPLLSGALPPLSVISPQIESLRDMSWLAHALYQTDAQRLTEILDPPQREAWRQMQAFFPRAAVEGHWEINVAGNFGHVTMILYTLEGYYTPAPQPIIPQDGNPIQNLLRP